MVSKRYEEVNKDDCCLTKCAIDLYKTVFNSNLQGFLKHEHQHYLKKASKDRDNDEKDNVSTHQR